MQEEGAVARYFSGAVTSGLCFRLGEEIRAIVGGFTRPVVS